MGDEHRTTLAILVASSGETHAEHVAALSTFARQLGESNATFSLRQFDRWLTGESGVRPRPATRRVLEAYYGQSIDALLASGSGTPRRTGSELTTATSATVTDQRADHVREPAAWLRAHESSEHSALASMHVDPESIEALGARVRTTANRYPITTMAEMFEELVRVRDQGYQLLERTSRPSQLRDLYVLAGQVCALLGDVSYDLGYRDAAAEHLDAALAYGRIADHSSLIAFTSAIQCTIEFWSGHPRRGIRFATAGLERRPTGSIGARLHAVRARSWALEGHAERVEADLRAADHAFDDIGSDDLADQVGGEFRFTRARFETSSAAAYLALGDGRSASLAARRALGLYAQAPEDERCLGAEYGSRLDLVWALVLEGDLTEAAEVMSTVLDLAPAHRTTRLAYRVRGIRAGLTRDRNDRSQAASALAEMVAEFLVGCRVGALDPSGGTRVSGRGSARRPIVAHGLPA
jgi:hypothetical protein